MRLISIKKLPGHIIYFGLIIWHYRWIRKNCCELD